MDLADNAQSPAPETDSQNTPAPVEGQPQDGQTRLNARFSELTQTINSQREMLANQQALTQQLLATQAALQQQIQSQHRPHEPAIPTIQLPEGVDPAIAQTFQSITAAFQKTLDEQAKRNQELINQAVGGVRMTQEGFELQQALNGQPKEVQELAQRLFQNWRQQGYSGWQPRDAVTFARGQLGVTAAPARRAAPQDQVTPGGSVPPDPRTQELPAPLPDEQLRKMSLKEQEDYWAKRVGNTPIVY